LHTKPEVVEKNKQAVKAVAAPGRTLKVNETIVLDGSASVVDTNEFPEFYWKQVKGPAMVRALSPDKNKSYSSTRTDALNFPVWTCSPSAPGEYAFVLQITSGKKEKEEHVESDPVTFTVVGDNLPPVASVFVAKKNVEVGEMVKLDATASKDPEGQPLTFVWGQIPGKRAPRNWIGFGGPSVEFKAEEEGEYTVALTVNDGQLSSEPFPVTITVSAANQAPTVRLPKNMEAMVRQPVLIKAEVHDAESDRCQVLWTCLEPSNLKIPADYAAKKTLQFLPKNTGTFVFKCTVTDSKGRSDSAQIALLVKDSVNLAPTAIIDGPKTTRMGEKAQLSGARSADPEKKPLTYMWKQEGGPKIAGKAPAELDSDWAFTPRESGKYMFSLTVSDGVNLSEPERFEFTVTPANRAPVAHIGATGNSVAVGQAWCLIPQIPTIPTATNSRTSGERLAAAAMSN